MAVPSGSSLPSDFAPAERAPSRQGDAAHDSIASRVATATPTREAGDPAPDPQMRDRVFGSLAAARQAVQRGELSIAARLLDTVEAVAVHPDLVPAIGSAREGLRDAVTEVAAHIALDLAAGHALRAAARVEALLAELHPSVAATVDAEWKRRGWPPRLRVLASEGINVEAALPDRRAVLISLGPEWREGTVVGAAAPDGELTVRVETEAGVVFPTVRREFLEPIAPTAMEIEAQLRACLGAGRAAATWAWWAMARVRGQTIGRELERVLREG